MGGVPFVFCPFLYVFPILARQGSFDSEHNVNEIKCRSHIVKSLKEFHLASTIRILSV